GRVGPTSCWRIQYFPSLPVHAQGSKLILGRCAKSTRVQQPNTSNPSLREAQQVPSSGQRIRWDLSCKIEKFRDPQTVREKWTMDSSPNHLLRSDLRNHGSRFPFSLAHPEQLLLDRSSALDFRPALRSI